MKIIGSEPEIARYLLEGREITTKSTEDGKWYATDEMGRQESIEMCFSPTTPSRECVGVTYDKVTEASKFNASINFGEKRLLWGCSPLTVLSYLESFEEPNVKAKLKSKFIHRKNPFFIMESSVTKEIKTEDFYFSHTKEVLFRLPRNIPMNVKGISREEDSLWNELYEIQYLNSRIPEIKSKEELFGIIAGLKEHIERANTIYLNQEKNSFELTLTVKNI